MQHGSAGLRLPLLLLLLLLFFLRPLTSADLEEAEKVPVEVIVDSSPCSTTCGLGLKTQTLCLLKDGEAAMEEGKRSHGGAEVSKECRVRKVKCLESWQCGLTTMTVTSGERVELDCLGEVMEAMGRFSWRVLWRQARGVISSDDSLFARWEAPQLDRVVLDPVREEDAGTYRCDVQDATFRRVKRVYWGVRVLPAGALNLDFERSVGHSEADGKKPQNETVTDDETYVYRALTPVGGICVAIVLLTLCTVISRERLRRLLVCGRRPEPGARR